MCDFFKLVKDGLVIGFLKVIEGRRIEGKLIRFEGCWDTGSFKIEEA